MIYLSATVKAIESLITARDTIKFNNVEPSKQEEVFETEIKLLKDNSIAYLLQLHPRFYRDALKFNDWESSMLYLNNNKDEAFKMWKK